MSTGVVVFLERPHGSPGRGYCSRQRHTACLKGTPHGEAAVQAGKLRQTTPRWQIGRGSSFLKKGLRHGSKEKGASGLGTG